MSNSVNQSSINSTLGDAFRIARIAMLAIASSLLFHVMIVEVVRRTVEQGPSQLSEFTRLAFYSVAFLSIVGSHMVRILMMRKPVSGIDELANRLKVTTVITAALSELPIVTGLLLFLFDGQYGDFYVLGFISFYLMLRNFPRLSQWESIANAQLGKFTPHETGQ